MAAQLGSQFCFCTAVHSRTDDGLFGTAASEQPPAPCSSSRYPGMLPSRALPRLNTARLSLRCLLPLSATIAVLTSHPAQAAAVKMGADDGTLVFVPASLSVPAGERITFVNNKGFPHNVIFQNDGVPEGVHAEAISHRDYMNEQGEQFVVTLTQKGLYKFFCEPHRAARMLGEITVS